MTVQQNAQQRRIVSYDSQGRPIFARRSQDAPATNQPTAIDVDLELEEEDDQFYSTRQPTSIRRYDRPAAPAQRPKVHAHPHQRIDLPPAAAPRQQRKPNPNQNKATPPEVIYVQASHPQRRVHWSVYVGITMVFTTALCIGIILFYTWWPVQQDDWMYGRPRTYQTDAVVGQGDSKAHPSHFIVLNLNRHILIIEIKGGDPARSSMFVGPTLYGQGGDLAPVTLAFPDVNGNGHPEMILLFQGNQIIFLNKEMNGQWQFVPQSTH